jgi:hypothetical protein
MDELINVFKNVSVKEFDESVQILIERFEKSDLFDPDNEWTELSKNYSKLFFLNELIKKHEPMSPNFMKCLGLFMETVDRKTQYYLKEVWWEAETEFQKDTMRIEKIFEESLNTSDSMLKIKLILEAYSILVPIAEYFRDEKYIFNVPIDFERQFKKCKH